MGRLLKAAECKYKEMNRCWKVQFINGLKGKQRIWCIMVIDNHPSINKNILDPATHLNSVQHMCNVTYIERK